MRPRSWTILLRIGCPAIAEIAQQAVDALALPQLTVAAIEAAMGTSDEARDRVLHRCDLLFYGKADLVTPLFAYVQAHPDGIRI